MFSLSESTTVSAAIIAKIPIVTPVKDKMVRNAFCVSAFQANLKLSNIKRININALFFIEKTWSIIYFLINKSLTLQPFIFHYLNTI